MEQTAKLNINLKNNLKEKILNAKRKGFSFIEILVALVMIVSLSVGAFFVYSEAQQTRKMAQMHSDMNNIISGVLVYESLNINSQLPADLPELVDGLAANESVDGSAHDNIVTSVKAPDGNFVDPWGNAYVYDQAERTLTCTPNDASGAAMTPIVKQF